MILVEREVMLVSARFESHRRSRRRDVESLRFVTPADGQDHLDTGDVNVAEQESGPDGHLML